MTAIQDPRCMPPAGLLSEKLTATGWPPLSGTQSSCFAAWLCLATGWQDQCQLACMSCMQIWRSMHGALQQYAHHAHHQQCSNRLLTCCCMRCSIS